MEKLSAVFTRERECKHSVRYKPIDETGETITSLVYIKKQLLSDLNYPNKLKITIEKC